MLSHRRCLRAALAVVLASTTAAQGAAQDPFAIALPNADTEAPEGAPSASGDGNVSEQHGTAAFSFPIEVPPGRSGIQPALGLTYSSAAPLRGGIAAGWSLDLPTIERDADSPEQTWYRLSLDGNSQILVGAGADPGPGTRFRAEIDDGFARVQRSGNTWTVLTPDGRVRTFAGDVTSSDQSSRWNLTSEKDAFGNEIVYSWGRHSVSGNIDFVLQSIEYTSNAAAALAAHARVDFAWHGLETCGNSDIPIGAQHDHRFRLQRIRGIYRLNQIKISVRETPGAGWHLRRQYTLGYNAAALSCASQSPMRLLERIETTAWNQADQAVTAPPVRFTYGAIQPDHSMLVGLDGHLETGTEEGPESQRIDFDGDGLLDRVRVAMPADGEKRCRFYWRKGTYGGGLDANEEMIPLPTARWKEGVPMEEDACTLKGQLAWHGTNLNHVASGQYCAFSAGVLISYNFMDWDGDRDLDLVVQSFERDQADPCEDFDLPEDPGDCTIAHEDNGGGPAPCPVGSPEGTTCNCPDGQEYDERHDECHEPCPNGHTYDPSIGACVDECADFEGCTGETFPDPSVGLQVCPISDVGSDDLWRVYINDPQRVNAPRFDATHADRILDAPAPMPIPSSAFGVPTKGMPRLPALIDMNGDGWLDVIEPVGAGGVGPAAGIWVKLGDGQGNFPTRREWRKPTWSQWGDALVELAPNVLEASSSLEMLDVNGDGLDDLLVRAALSSSAPRKLYVAYNTGVSYDAALGRSVGGFAALRELGPDLAVSVSRTDFHPGWISSLPLSRGWRADQRRWVDVDGDGLPERVDLATGASVELPSTNRSVARPQLGVAGTWMDPIWEPLEQAVRALHRRAWYRQSDYVDVTGDGVPDLVTAHAGGLLAVRTAPPGTPPMRLLTGIDNGRGAVTTFEYGHSNELVALAPGRRAPSTWVVKRVTVTPGGGQPAMTVDYTYADPVAGKRTVRDVGPPQFLGFERVVATRSGQAGPSSARTTRTFDYAVGLDRRGHVALEVDELWTGQAWRPTTRVARTFINQPVANHASSFTYVSASTTTTYDSGGAAVATKEEREVWTPWLWTNGHALFFENTESQVWEAAPVFPVVRVTRRDFAERVGQSPYVATDYRILPILEETQKYSVFTGYTTVASTTTIRDGYGLPVQTVVATGTTGAITVRTFNTQTGQVLTEKRPRQVAAGSNLVTSFGYDAHKLYAATTTNERGHIVGETRDLATGVVVRRTGPNVRYVSTPGCTMFCFVLPSYEPEEWTIDGFGRVKEHRVATDAANGGYALTPVERTDYYDSLIPNFRSDARLRDFGGTVWLTTGETYDGLGRTLAHVEYHQVTGKPEAVTTYAYDAGGGLRETRVPDPRETDAYNSGQVVYTYERDGLGRVTRFVRPDGSGDHVSHDGVVVTTTPFDGDTLGAATAVTRDSLGRLREVREHDNPSEGQIALTQYDYDVLDRMTLIRDADGQITTMSYDQRGLRTGVTRGTRTWTYVYDVDGNMIEQRTPPGGSSVAEHTAVSTYDELGRRTSYTPAPRGMSSARRAQLGIGTITTTYDSGANAVGRPTRVTQPGLFTIDYGYDVRGNIKREQRNLTLAGSTGATLNVTEYVDRTFNARGAPLDVIWSTGPRWRYRYDARGQVSQVEWLEPSSSQYRTLASYTRTVAGAPRERLSHWNQRRVWSYDELGRVTYDRIHASNGTTWAERNYGFDGFGHLHAVGGEIAGKVADATYAYDQRGRIKSVSGPDAYSASISYSAGGNVQSANVSGAADVPDRDVLYQYGAVDPQAVDRLVDRNNGATMMSLAYDPAGNVSSRDSATLTWGGDDQLREYSQGTTVERYYYAGPGQRIAAVGPEGVRTWFGEMEGLFTTGGAVQRRWHHIAAGEPIARVQTIGATTTIELQYADALENLMLSMSTSGSVLASYLYGAFGEVVASTGDTETHRRHFNGKDADEVSGLRFYGYRSYDPVTLRWTAGDPLYRFAPDRALTEPQRANLYAFSSNNPVRFLDPDGREDTVDNGIGILNIYLPGDLTIEYLDNVTSWVDSGNDGTVGGALMATAKAPVAAVAIFFGTPIMMAGDAIVSVKTEIYDPAIGPLVDAVIDVGDAAIDQAFPQAQTGDEPSLDEGESVRTGGEAASRDARPLTAYRVKLKALRKKTQKTTTPRSKRKPKRDTTPLDRRQVDRCIQVGTPLL